jgi:zinc protease
VQAVTSAQVQEYAGTHLSAGGTHVVVVGDAAQFGAALAKAHPGVATLQADGIDLDSADLKPVK